MLHKSKYQLPVGVDLSEFFPPNINMQLKIQEMKQRELLVNHINRLFVIGSNSTYTDAGLRYLNATAETLSQCV